MTEEQVLSLHKNGTYKGRPLQGKLIETHISWVILSGPYAFKIKKPMHYSFLDFSTLEKRKICCERELILNQRLSDIYLDVLPIKVEAQKIFIGLGAGKAIEYTVRMKKMQNAKKMDIMLLDGRINECHISSLAKVISKFHQKASIIKTAFDIRQAKTDFNDILTELDWIKRNAGLDYKLIVEKAVAYSDRFIEENWLHIKNRVKSGFRRDVHGDLHSKNIFLYRNPVVFDCIEFNDSFRQLDIINELAFFCMDLESFNRWDLSDQFMGEYLNLFPCMERQEDWKLFRYYKCYRSNVRAKVNILRARQTGDDHKLEGFLHEIKKYLDLVERYIKVDSLQSTVFS